MQVAAARSLGTVFTLVSTVVLHVVVSTVLLHIIVTIVLHVTVSPVVLPDSSVCS